MSQENIDRIRAGYETFNRTGEYDVDLLAPDFELHSSIIDATGVFHGRDALRSVLRELQEAFEQLSYEAEKFLVAPGGEIIVFICVRGRGRGSRVETDTRMVHVWTYRDDKAVRLVVYEERVKALKAVGLSEQDISA
jgi:ketosteroid isomerase-like protein